jgi:hypothetical protein
MRYPARKATRRALHSESADEGMGSCQRLGGNSGALTLGKRPDLRDQAESRSPREWSAPLPTRAGEAQEEGPSAGGRLAGPPRFPGAGHEVGGAAGRPARQLPRRCRGTGESSCWGHRGLAWTRHRSRMSSPSPDLHPSPASARVKPHRFEPTELLGGLTCRWLHAIVCQDCPRASCLGRGWGYRPTG